VRRSNHRPLVLPVTTMSVDDLVALNDSGGSVAVVILPERVLLDRCLESLRLQQDALVAEKTLVAEQSGDNWHDGAFNATDAAARMVSSQADGVRKMSGLPVVASPDDDEKRVTAGSLVTFVQGSETFEILLVGNVGLYRDDTGLSLCSVGSPLSRVLLGLRVGDVSSFRGQSVRVTGLKQSRLGALVEANLALYA